MKTTDYFVGIIASVLAIPFILLQILWAGIKSFGIGIKEETVRKYILLKEQLNDESIK